MVPCRIAATTVSGLVPPHVAKEMPVHLEQAQARHEQRIDILDRRA
jgi:hypothetical protein